MSNIIIHQVQQRSPEWFNLRIGKITGSEVCKLFKGTEVKERYIYSKASELIIGILSDTEEYHSKLQQIHLNRGIREEDVAKSRYMLDKGTIVEDVGLIYNTSNKYLACSPDGLVGKDGIIEIKVFDTTGLFQTIIQIKEKGINAITKDHYIQMQFNLLVSERYWCDYVLYNPKYTEILNQGFYVYRIEKDPVMQEKIKIALTEAISRIEECMTLYKEIWNLKEVA